MKPTCLPVILSFLAIIHFPLFALSQDTTAVRNLRKKAISFLSTYPDSLLYYRDSSYHLATEINDNIGIGESFTDLGIYHWIKGNYAAAIRAYDTSNLIYNRIHRPNKQLNNFSNLGMVYSRLGDFPKAIKFLLEALRLAEAADNQDAQAKVYNSLGVAYKNQGNPDLAFNSYNKALLLFKETNNQESVAGSYSNIGNIYQLKKDYDQALQYQLKSLAIFDSLHNFRGLVTCHNNISDIYLAKKNFGESLKYRQQALELSREKGFFTSQVVALSGLGLINTELGNYTLAEKYLLEAIALTKERNYRTEMANLYKHLSDCYKRLGKTENALLYFEQYAALKDSLLNQESLLATSNLRISYELEKKEASIALLKKDNEITKLSRNRTVIAAVSLLLIAALMLSWQRYKIRKDRQLLSQQEKLHETEQALSQSKLNSAKLREEELRKEIDYKNKSLTTYALSMVQKNEMLEEVKESVELILKMPDNQAEHFKKLSRIIDYGFTLDKDWDDFKLYFEEVHTDFFVRLREKYPDLSAADLKLCALIRLNLNIKQAAAILRISPDSAKIARYRLRKKFNLQTEENLSGFIMSV